MPACLFTEAALAELAALADAPSFCKFAVFSLSESFEGLPFTAFAIARMMPAIKAQTQSNKSRKQRPSDNNAKKGRVHEARWFFIFKLLARLFVIQSYFKY